MSTYTLSHLLQLWSRSDLTAEQAVGHLLQTIVGLTQRLVEQEKRQAEQEKRLRQLEQTLAMNS